MSITVLGASLAFDSVFRSVSVPGLPQRPIRFPHSAIRYTFVYWNGLMEWLENLVFSASVGSLKAVCMLRVLHFTILVYYVTISPRFEDAII